jgi:secondary thiamine-phosphate synthase enzyme
MRQSHQTITVETKGPGLYDVTRKIVHALAESAISRGLVTCFIQHTSASLLIQENADPAVLADLENFMRRTVARDERLYRHTTEGPDDMPSHIRSALTQTSLSIPVHGGELMLGTWQGIYLFEHRDAGHRRDVIVHVMGE